MKFIIKCALLLMPAFALATPAFAICRDAQCLYDSQEPGSVIVFPKFVNQDRVTVDGIADLARTEIEIGAVCPHRKSADLSTEIFDICAEHQSVKVRFHWVCPANQAFESKQVCKQTDFDVTLTVWGKLAFAADGRPINANSPRVPAAPCARGYLIGWVINPANDQPVKFDGLIGDAVIRLPDITAGTGAFLGSTAVSAYEGKTIQAADATQLNFPAATSAITLVNGRLAFDGVAGHYTMVNGTVYGDVIYDKTTTQPPPLVGPLVTTHLTMLTLDVESNLPNNATFVPLNFYNESLATVSSTNPLFEQLLSTSWEFICWTQVQLSTIHPSLTQAFFATRKGIFQAGPATNQEILSDTAPVGPVTLMVLVTTTEGPAADTPPFMRRSYIYQTYTDSRTIPTFFNPF
jgi:hypothetical protein